ncbi:hypothetical protein N5U17_02075 [Aliarcobacter butzleri]|jgi:hypothetical protein|uniref:hypothetical protein n=1 Tax=Aliarcobacter butzleri TaxID=28197 RepID=UPI0021B3D605|nr:hypothetical protein [Aliarcobacter butzleri]MCT7603004.1 hypothetical protein [Aliarcobacter butzleri]
MYFFKGIFQIFLGIAIIIGFSAVGIAWLGVCFGTVIVGILLLFFAPHILLFPFGLAIYGIAYIESGFRFLTEKG